MAKKTNQTMVINTVIGAGTEFVGDLNTKDTTRIDGVIRGNIQSEGTVIIGTSGQVEGNIQATEVSIAGMIKGDMTATNRIEILSSAHIEGNITTKSLCIDEHAVFQGVCNMNRMEETESK